MSVLPNIHTQTHPDYQKYRHLRGAVLVLEGPVGAGKTTAGRTMVSYLNGIGLSAKFFTEPVNYELLSLYISDMKKYAFSFQMFMLSQRVNVYRDATAFAQTGGVAVIDRSMLGDAIFAMAQRENGFFTDAEWKVYQEVLTTLHVLQPTRYIYLDSSLDVTMSRIRKRGIASEQGYTREYLQQLLDIYLRHLEEWQAVRIPWDEDLSDASAGEVTSRILGMI